MLAVSTSELARICVERGYERFEWSVLHWNEPAIGFYTALGAEPLAEWRSFRLTGAPLRDLGGTAGTIVASDVTSASEGGSHFNQALPLSN